MKDKWVILPIRVPNSEFCYHKEQGFRCQYFSLLIGCGHGFKPIKESDTIYKKDSECVNLLWEENLR